MEIIEGSKGVEEKMRMDNLHLLWGPKDNNWEKGEEHILKGNDYNISRKSWNLRSGEHIAFWGEQIKRYPCLDI